MGATEDSSIPGQWAETTLGEIATFIQRGKSPKYIESSKLPVINQKSIRWNGINKEYLKYIHPDSFSDWPKDRFIKTNDILINSTGTGTIGRACIVGEHDCKLPKVVDSHVTILRTTIVQKYVFNWLKSRIVQDIILNLCTGSTNQVELSKDKINSIHIPLAPLNEQKRIVEKLDSILPKIKNAKARLEKIPVILKRFRQSVLAAACSGRLTEDWREKNPNRSPLLFESIEEINDPDDIFSKSSLLQLPDEWCYVRFNMIGKLKSGGTPSKSIQRYWNGDIPWVSAKDMKKEYIDDSMDKITQAAINEAKVRLLPINSLLFVVRGMILIHTFPVALTKVSLAINQDLKGLIPNKEFNPKYLLFFFKFQGVLILQHEKEASHGTRRIEMTTLQNWAVAAPPIKEQQEIVRRVEKLFSLADSLEAKYKKAFECVEKIEQSVLAKAFRGELVEPDPNDEPAAELLKRILAEKAKLESGKNKRKK